MSQDNNTELLERAAEAIDEFEGTVIARVIEKDIDNHDYESLERHVAQAEAQLAQEEFEANDVY